MKIYSRKEKALTLGAMLAALFVTVWVAFTPAAKCGGLAIIGPKGEISLPPACEAGDIVCLFQISAKGEWPKGNDEINRRLGELNLVVTDGGERMWFNVGLMSFVIPVDQRRADETIFVLPVFVGVNTIEFNPEPGKVLMTYRKTHNCGRSEIGQTNLQMCSVASREGVEIYEVCQEDLKVFEYYASLPVECYDEPLPPPETK